MDTSGKQTTAASTALRGSSGVRETTAGTVAGSLAIGLTGGVVGSLIGLGGGFLMIPLMTATMGLTQHQAHGTSLVAVLFTAVGAALTYGNRGSVAWVAAAGVALSGMVFARLGARFSHQVSTRRLQGFFGWFLVFTAALLPTLRLLLRQAPEQAHVAWWLQAVTGTGVGVISGFMSGLLGIGGGAIVVAALVLTLGLSQHTAQGTALAAMIPTALSGSITHHRLGHTVWQVAPLLGIGSIAGGWLGAVLAHRLASDALRNLFSASIFLLGLYYVRRSRAPAAPAAAPSASEQEARR